MAEWDGKKLVVTYESTGDETNHEKQTSTRELMENGDLVMVSINYINTVYFLNHFFLLCHNKYTNTTIMIILITLSLVIIFKHMYTII